MKKVKYKKFLSSLKKDFKKSFKPKYLKNDVKHFFINLPLTLIALLFFYKFGFYGWPFFLSLIFIHFSISLDDWVEKERPFPYYLIPFIGYAFWNFPLITVLALVVGLAIINLRVFLKRDGFIYERLEGIGNLFIYVVPLTIPIGGLSLRFLPAYIGATIYILFVDSFHKLGHKETVYRKWTWIFGLGFLFLYFALFTANSIYILFLGLILATLIPFKLLEKKRRVYGWAYYQVWESFVAIIGFGIALFLPYNNFLFNLLNV